MHFANKISCKPFRGLTQKTIPVLVTGFFITLHAAFAQISDDFSDGEFSSSPHWSGTTEHFIVNSDKQLQLSAVAAGRSWLSLEVVPDFNREVEWQFFLAQSFSPSGANHGRFYLMSDQADLSGPLNGYYLQFGEAGANDAIELFRQSGTAATSVCRSTSAAIGTPFAARIKVVRTSQGEWRLSADYAGGVEFVPEASGYDAMFTSSQYNGILFTYTITNATRFIFDDLVLTCETMPDNNPADTVSFSYRDIIFSEILPDPSPQLGLPDVEFVELFNRSEKAANLAGWNFSDPVTSALLPSFVLAPGEYVILTSVNGAAKFNPSENAIPLSPFPSMNNAGDAIALRNPKGVLIDSLQYTTEWFRNSEKSEGGWSLELIDPNNICEDSMNWTAAEAESGGTPGKVNSVRADKPDNTGPRIMNVIATDSIRLTVVFNEKLDAVAPPASAFAIQPRLTIASVKFADGFRSELKLVLSDPITPGQTYTIAATGIYDCPGNRIQDAFSRATFILPEAVSPGDVVINEVLFNPRPSGVDFVEIFNKSRKVVDIKNWSLRNTLSGSGGNERRISSKSSLLHPGEFRTLTPDVNVLKGEYISTVESAVLETEIPPLNDDEGTVALLDAHGYVLDSVYYVDTMHSPFVQDKEGVSLERISGSALTTEPSNWTSASATSGFATPGYENSNARADIASGEGPVTVEPEIIQLQVSHQDFARINYRFQRGGYVANVRIFDQRGRTVRQLASNELLGTEGFFRWDGDLENGGAAGTGYYMVWFEVFDSDGVVKTYRRRIAIF